MPSDHNAQWLKIKADDVFGYNMKQPVPILARRLQLQNPQTVDNFLNNYEAILCSEGLLQEAFETNPKCINTDGQNL